MSQKPTLARKLDALTRDGGATARFLVLRRLAGALVPGYRFRRPDLDWMQNAAFNAHLDRFGERRGIDTDRRWMVSELAKLVARVPGDTAECGVFRGSSSALILAANRAAVAAGDVAARHHFLFDSFEGLSAPAQIDGKYWKRGDLAAGEDLVRANLGPGDDYTLLKGWIPARFADVAERRFALVHVDVDLGEPTADSIAFFYPRLAPGGLLIIDDYGFPTCPGATAAVTTYFADKPEAVIALPSGGAFVLKQGG